MVEKCSIPCCLRHCFDFFWGILQKMLWRFGICVGQHSVSCHPPPFALFQNGLNCLRPVWNDVRKTSPSILHFVEISSEGGMDRMGCCVGNVCVSSMLPSSLVFFEWNVSLSERRGQICLDFSERQKRRSSERRGWVYSDYPESRQRKTKSNEGSITNVLLSEHRG